MCQRIASRGFLFYFALLVLIGNSCEVQSSDVEEGEHVESFQPEVTTLESLPSRKSSGIITLPEGSPWCDGKPTKHKKCRCNI